MNKLLPLGTVCKIKNSFSMIMVIGYFPINKEENRIYQYTGINFPFGLSREEKYLMFDEDSVETVLHYGYENEEIIAFNEKYKKLGNSLSKIKELHAKREDSVS